MIKKFEKFNESVRDKMTPKSEEDIKRDIGKMKPNDLLLQSARGGSLSLVKNAIRRGSKDEQALVNASIFGHSDIVEYLIDEVGYDVHYKGEVPLLYAISNGRMDVVRVLLDRGADIHYHNESPLNLAISHCYWDIANYLIKRGADIKRLHSNLVSTGMKISQKEVDRFMYYYMTNEGVRDKMTPISKSDLQDKLKNITDRDLVDTLMNDYDQLITILGEEGLVKVLEKLPPNRYLRQFTGLTDHRLLRLYLMNRDVDDFTDRSVRDMYRLLRINHEYDLCDMVRGKWGNVLNESLKDEMTGKPIEHITNVGTYHRYDFIEDWADSEKYGKSVGYIIVDSGCDLFLSSFTIWKPYKGMGLGRKYLNRILDELSKFKEYPWVALTVTKDNEIAIKLYRSVGFRDVNDVPEYEGPGKNYDNERYYYMIKENK